MSSERWQQVEEIFQTALDLAPDQRLRYVTAACTGDAELRQEVEALLTQYESAGDFLDAPLQERSGLQALAALMDTDADPMVGRHIGAYRIEREIGRGGMGAVYLATRADNAFQRRVAIKVIKRGMDTDFILRRFRHERRILAALDHQNIARLLDGGATETGLPYFVMEYIEGEPLYAYCDARRLGVRERLRLFCQVCDAVAYAHQNQVIHRDIKPSNILVTASAVPKLFDFGISKLLNTELVSDTAPQTATAMRLMTVEYASPEQVQGLPVTFLSDVYSLGVLLYELLTGHRPYRFRNRMLHEMARVITEEEPERPSVAVNQLDNLLPFAHVDQEAITVGHLCEVRGETPDSLSGELYGSLDNITLKALRKEPAERYQSAADLREDISRYLEGRSISAPFYFPPAVKGAPARSGPARTKAAKTIAVLPLKILNLDASSDTGDKFISVGLADAMITRLSGVRSLAVRPTSAILRYGDETVNPLQAGRELDVDFVLDGRIKSAQNRVRVSLQLLDIKNGTSIWANQFDEQFTGALELEDSISTKVTDALLPELDLDARRQMRKRGTDNAQAFDAYLRGRYFWNQFTPESLPKAIGSFQKAIALDPNYAMPHVGVADFYMWACIYGILPPPECYPKARAAALRALELDDTLGEAYAALALIAESEWDWAEAERLYKRAFELNPNYPLAHEWYSSLLVGTGRSEEGIKEIRRAEELDPLSTRAVTLTAWTTYQAHLFTEAFGRAQQVIDLDKNYFQGYVQIGNCLEQMGRAEEAVTASQRSVQLMPDSALPKYVLCFALAAANRLDEAREVLGEMKSMAATQYVKPYFLAMAHVALDERAAAFELFEKVFAERDPWVVWFGTEPKLDRLRTDTRFVELFRQTNNPLALGRTVGLEQPQTSREKSIAVLPLKLLGASQSDATGEKYLGVGLADALITRLSNVRRFIVRPTSSVLRYGGEDADPLVAGRELGVDLVLDGHIRRAGERIRISLQLLDVRASSNIWAHRFDERFTDALSLEDAISEQVTEALIPELTGEERRQLKKRETDSTEAFEAYLRGRYHWNTFTPDGFGKAFAAYQNAINVDPSYALAYAGVADYYIWMGIYGVLPPRESFAAAEEAVRKALDLDEGLAEAHATLGFVEQLKYDWATAEMHLLRALELNPKLAVTHVWYSLSFLKDGRFDEGLQHTRRALELDPLTPFNQYYLGWCLYFARRFDESILEHQRGIAAEPLYMPGYYGLAWTLRYLGRHAEALRAMQRARELSTDSPFVSIIHGQTLAAAGKRLEAEGILAEVDRDGSEHLVLPYHRAILFSLLGDKEKALDMLERAYREGDGWLVWMGVEPQFDSLHADARFIKLLDLINCKRPLI